MRRAVRSTSRASLGPQLTKFDRRVLELVPGSGCTGHRALEIRSRLNQRHGFRHGMNVYLGEVRMVLRGLEHLGLVEQTAGWWRRK